MHQLNPTLIRQLWTNDIYIFCCKSSHSFHIWELQHKKKQILAKLPTKEVMSDDHNTYTPTYHSTQATIISFLHRDIYIYTYIVQLPPDKTLVQPQLGWLVEGRMHIYLFNQNLTPKSIRQCLISTSFKSSWEKIPPNQQNDWKNV